MPITSSAKKALRASKHKTVYNARRKSDLSDTVKKVKKLVSAKSIAEAKELLPKAFQAIDKACKTHMIHKNTASRKKSRLAKMLAKAEK